MTAINPETHMRIKAYLEIFIENTVERYKNREFAQIDHFAEYLERKSKEGDLKPFHVAIVPPEVMKISAFERGFVTSLGTSFEECAKLIALDYHSDAQRSYDIVEEVSLAALDEIDHQVVEFEHSVKSNNDRPSVDEMIESVLNARQKDDLVERKVRADLYIRAKGGTKFFFEMKTAKPNKGQCLEVLQRLLRFHLLSGGKHPNVQSYFAMAYNPYGPSRSDYKWSMTRNYFPFDQALVIGHEFWTIVGNDTVYEELLDIYREVGNDKRKYIIDTLAFGF